MLLDGLHFYSAFLGIHAVLGRKKEKDLEEKFLAKT